MAGYSIDPARPVADSVRRIASEQVRRARRDLLEPADDLTAAVHDCRKRCKKVRGLLRLVREPLGDAYGEANATFRDAARSLGALRDAHALRDTFEGLVAAAGATAAVAPVRVSLHDAAAAATADATPEAPAVGDAVALLEQGALLVETWDFPEDGFDAVADGLRLTYRRGRRALATAVEEPSAPAFHEYRKRTKYTWYHVRLLVEVAPSVLGPLAEAFHDLSDTLGDEHDLAVLTEHLLGDPGRFGGEECVGAAMGLVDARRAQLQRRAVRLGARLHAERPRDFVRRMRGYWGAWEVHGPEESPPAPA